MSCACEEELHDKKRIVSIKASQFKKLMSRILINLALAVVGDVCVININHQFNLEAAPDSLEAEFSK